MMFYQYVRRQIFLFILLLPVISPAAFSVQLSPESKISLLTCDPGDQMYTMFGHSAIRVLDPVHDIDEVFNYGTFNFNTPYFYIKFIRGKLKYKLSIARFIDFLKEYHFYKESVYEQVLNLTHDEKIRTYEFLKKNYRPENRYYLYDFYFDNCATRIRDVFEHILKDKLVFNEPPDNIQYTFRELTELYTEPHPWPEIGINLALGQPADRMATYREYMFLPDFMLDAFSHAKIRGKKGNIPFVKESHYLYKAPEEKEKLNGFLLLSPFSVLFIAFVVLLLVTVIELKNRSWYVMVDKTLFFITGLVGLLVLFLWFGTDHSPTKDNWNLLWAWPLHFIIAFFIRKQKNRLLSRYFFLSGAVCLSNLIFWKIIPQTFDAALIPLILLLSFRSFYLFYRCRKFSYVSS